MPRESSPASRRRLCAVALGLFAAGLAAGALPGHATAAGPVIDQLSFVSQRGDYIGAGESAWFNPTNASVTVGGSLSSVQVNVNGSGHTWTLMLAAPTGTSLSPGYYGNAQRFAGGATPGVAFFGDGRGCNADYGDFTVNAIATDSSGMVNLIDATFNQTCESTTNPLLSGEVRVGVPAAVNLTGPAEMKEGGVGAFTATVAPGSAGTVTYYDGQTSLGTATLDGNGTASIGVALAAGAHVITAHYNGDSVHPAATSGFVLQQVAPLTTTTSYQYSSAPGDWVGQGTSNSYSPPSTTFGISGSLGGVTVTVNSSSDNWTIVLAAPIGSQLGVGTYSNAMRAEFQSGNAPGLDVFGDGRGCNNVYGSFTVNAIDSTATGAVDFLDASFTQYCESPTNPPLSGTIKYGVPPEGTTTVSLSSSASSVVQGNPVTFTAVVGQSAVSGGGWVMFNDNGTNMASGVPFDPNGVATLTTSSLSVGVHNVTASYGGSMSIEPATSTPITVTVQPSVTTTSLSASPTEQVSGAAVSLTAMVTARNNGTPSGSVTFADGATTLGTAPLDGTATATLSVSSLAVGTHGITASYSGDSLHQPSTSGTVTVTVDNPTSTALSASSTSIKAGQTVKLHATVTSPAGTPSGTVSFYDGSTLLGSATLSRGAASFTTPALARGTHSLTARYNGGTLLFPSTSAAVTVTAR